MADSGYILLFSMLAALGSVFVLVQAVNLSANSLKTIVSAMNCTFAMALFFLISSDSPPDIKPSALYTMFTVINLVVVLQMFGIIREKRRTISPMSVKEGFDRMDMGICFCFENGLPKLINHRMNQIVMSLTGEFLSDAGCFWEKLESGSFGASIHGGDEPIVYLPEGKAYSFRRYCTDFNGEIVYELTASDITEEFLISHELEVKNEQVRKINTRLKALNTTIKYMIMEKETLLLKIKLHDNLGQALLMGRRFAADHDSVNKQELITLWKNKLTLLKNQRREEWQRSYHVSCERARLMGVELVIDGELPQEDMIVPVVDTALAVHTTNVMRHADGTHAYIKVTKNNDSYVLNFTNDGKPPSAPIKETGGLSNLRRQITQAGGTMQVEYSPVFELTVSIPLRDTEKYFRLSEEE